MKEPIYPFTLRKLSNDEGGGYYIEFPDLPGCASDGNSIAEAIENGADAVKCWTAAAREAGRTVPKPGSGEKSSGKWVQRVPKWLHARLVAKSKDEGVSLNTLVISLLAADVGFKKKRARHHSQKDKT